MSNALIYFIRIDTLHTIRLDKTAKISIVLLHYSECITSSRYTQNKLNLERRNTIPEAYISNVNPDAIIFWHNRNLDDGEMLVLLQTFL